MRRHRLLALAAPLSTIATLIASPPAAASSGVGIVPQGTQSDAQYEASAAANQVTNVFATSQRVSCYRPEVPYSGNFYTLILPYEFYYNADGSHNFKTNPNLEPNPAVAAEAITVSVRKHGAKAADDWTTNRAGAQDIIASYGSKGREPDKQWITIDTNPASPHFNRVYALWVVFDSLPPVPFASYADARADGTHTAWSKPQRLPTAGNNP